MNTKETAVDWYEAEDSVTASKWRRAGHDAVFVKDESGVSVVELGATGYLWMKNSDIAARLEKMFPDYWRELFAIAALRITDGPRFKSLAFSQSSFSSHGVFNHG